MGLSGDDQPLIQIGAVGGKDIFSLPPALKHSVGCIKDKGPYHKHTNKCCGGRSLGTKYGEHCKGKTQESTTHVTHEDFGGCPIVEQKSPTAGGKQYTQHYNQWVLQEAAYDRPPNPCYHGLRACDAVNPIHEV